MRIASDRRYSLENNPEAVWDAFSRARDFQRWWPWLVGFDGTGLAVGQAWNCVVQPPLPYRVAFALTIDEATRPNVVRASVAGDITGTARIDLAADPAGGSRLRLRADLGPSHRALRVIAGVARPLVRYGHDWVLDAAFRQFVEHADGRAGSTDGGRAGLPHGSTVEGSTGGSTTPSPEGAT